MNIYSVINKFFWINLCFFSQEYFQHKKKITHTLILSFLLLLYSFSTLLSLWFPLTHLARSVLYLTILYFILLSLFNIEHREQSTDIPIFHNRIYNVLVSIIIHAFSPLITLWKPIMIFLPLTPWTPCWPCAPFSPSPPIWSPRIPH